MRAALLLVAVFCLAPQYQAADLLTQAPGLLSKTEPEYTVAARRAGVEGTVLLYAEIGTDGRAHRITVIKGLGFGLDAKAIECVTRWKFSPGIKNGRRTTMPARIDVVFRNKGSAGIPA